MSSSKIPLKIGLTGGIGSGKSTVCKVLKSLSIPIFNSDNIAKEIYKDKSIVTEIKKQIGITVNEDNTINKKMLSLIIFNNKTKLQKLNKIIHPIVEKEFDLWSQNQNKKMVIKESALLFESKSFKKLDKIIYVYASQKNRINRVTKRDLRTKAEVLKIISNQHKFADIKKKVDYIIYNNNELLVPQIIRIINEIKKLL